MWKDIHSSAFCIYFMYFVQKKKKKQSIVYERRVTNLPCQISKYNFVAVCFEGAYVSVSRLVTQIVC